MMLLLNLNYFHEQRFTKKTKKTGQYCPRTTKKNKNKRRNMTKHIRASQTENIPSKKELKENTPSIGLNLALPSPTITTTSTVTSTSTSTSASASTSICLRIIKLTFI